MGLPGCLFVCHLILLLVCFLFKCTMITGVVSLFTTSSYLTCIMVIEIDTQGFEVNLNNLKF